MSGQGEEPAAAAVLAQLLAREPLFHRRELVADRRDVEREIADDFREVGASGRRYSREDVLGHLDARFGTADPFVSDGWEVTDARLRAVGAAAYLLTYTLRQGDRLTRRLTVWQGGEDGRWQAIYHQGTLAPDADAIADADADRPTAAEPAPDSGRQDLVDLFDAAWQRLTARLAGLGDAEWAWCPTADDRIGLRWRLGHITQLLSQPRTWQWLGAPRPRGHSEPAPTSAAEALAAAQAAYEGWRRVLTGPDVDLDAPVGAAAGRYAAATRRSVVLHVADELIHHAAEAALLRDLYDLQARR